MTTLHQAQAATKRSALGDGMARANTLHDAENSSRPSMIHHSSHKAEGRLPLHDINEADHRRNHQAERQPPQGHRAALLAFEGKKEKGRASNRNSAISTVSTNASDGFGRRKTHIGPWHLGKTLGKGATARVRMARHCITGELAAVKIVQKMNAQLTQSGSLASISKNDTLYDEEDEVRRMPFAIEREVAIMKLIKHPHIMQIYDIWENRTEIYLVLEFVDKGELFDHISKKGRLPEEEAFKYFRQLISALDYCHSLNICHRDLKPENILMTGDNNAKIADFGMAALQQHPEHRLTTSCGSPHYAAPEVIEAKPYTGDKVDVWSMGVILFACLSGYLPFDDPKLPKLLDRIKKGHYKMPPFLSTDAADLIRRMLVVNPHDRLSISQIWRHPVVRKYDYLDDFNGGRRCSGLRDVPPPVQRRSEIDKELLRSMRSCWHQYTEEELVDFLLSPGNNDQKVFYTLLAKHKEMEQENLIPDLNYSASDYHHVRPLAQVKRLATRQFSRTDSNGMRRTVSKFTVISNAGTNPSRQVSNASAWARSDAGETVTSYDPYRASRPQNLRGAGGSKANIIVHRATGNRLQQEIAVARGYGSIASSRRSGAHSAHMLGPRMGTRSSLSSSTRSRNAAGQVKVNLRSKRGVSFQHGQLPHLKQSEGEAGDRHQTPVRSKNPTKQMRSPVRSPTDPYIRSKKTTAYGRRDGGSPRRSPKKSPRKSPQKSDMFEDDVRQLSQSLAKNCDEAFNFNTSAMSTIPSSLGDRVYEHDRDSTPFSSFERNSSVIITRKEVPKLVIPDMSRSHQRQRNGSRPLPAPPARSESVAQQLAAARDALMVGNAIHSPRRLDRMAHINRLIVDEVDKRAVSAPTKRLGKYDKSLPSVNRFSNGSDGSGYHVDIFNQNNRHGSAQTAPESRMYSKMYGQDSGANGRHATARAVPPSSPPVRLPHLDDGWTSDLSSHVQPSRKSRKISPSDGPLGGGDYYRSSTPTNVDTDCRDSRQANDQRNSIQSDNSRKKKTNWFKRNSKEADSSNQPQDRTSNSQEAKAVEARKKNFGFGGLFKKRNSREDEEQWGLDVDYGAEEHTAPEIDDEWDLYGRPSRELAARDRQIEPRQNWMARLFRVKPAVGYVCLNLSKRRARQEIVAMLKSWRQFGVGDVICDKKRYMIFCKVDKKNFINAKPVSVAIEIMAVIEHGKRGFLSIARFTQESGAASSFNKVVAQCKETLRSKGHVVSNERKSIMMIKTLEGAAVE